MTDWPDNLALTRLCRDGDADAARALFERYGDRLLSLARRRLSQALASRVDPEDVVQGVFSDFFRLLQEGRFRIEQPDDLSKLLVRITIHKVLREVAFQTAARRSPAREAGQENADRDQLFAVLDREPSPEEAATSLDQQDHFLTRLTRKERRVVEMKESGYSTGDISRELGLHDRQVRRVVAHIREVAEKEGLQKV